MKTLFLLAFILFSVIIQAKTPVFGEDSPIIKLTHNNFDEETQGFKDKPWVILFYAPWCPHCKDIQVVYEELSEKLKGQMTFAQIDCEQNIQIKERYGVTGFPTILIVSNETGAYHKFRGSRTIEALEQFLTKTYKEFPGIDIPNRPSLFNTLKHYYNQVGTPIVIGGIVLVSLFLIVTLVDLAKGEKTENVPTINQLTNEADNQQNKRNKKKQQKTEEKPIQETTSKEKDSKKKQQKEKKNQ